MRVGGRQPDEQSEKRKSATGRMKNCRVVVMAVGATLSLQAGACVCDGRKRKTAGARVRGSEGDGPTHASRHTSVLRVAGGPSQVDRLTKQAQGGVLPDTQQRGWWRVKGAREGEQHTEWSCGCHALSAAREERREKISQTAAAIQGRKGWEDRQTGRTTK